MRALENIPDGFMECDGRELDPTAYKDLFKEIQYQYTNEQVKSKGKFQIPSCEGRVLSGNN
jgi:hypothetical protein